MTTHSQRALILYRRRRFINHLLTYLLINTLTFTYLYLVTGNEGVAHSAVTALHAFAAYAFC